MLGTLLNAVAIILATFIGLKLKKYFSKKHTTMIFQCMGLFAISMGMSLVIKTNDFLGIMLSLIFGGIIGEILDIEKALDKFSKQIEKKVKKRIKIKKGESFTEAFMITTLISCVGSLAILGAIEEGLGSFPKLLMIKSSLDFFTSLVIATTLGVGVALAALPVFVYQGLITLIVKFNVSFFSPILINEISAMGGLLLVGVGINILEIKKIKVTNMLPSLILIVVYAKLFLC